MSRHHRFSGMAKGPAWDRQRRQAFDRDGRRCQTCGRPGRLEAHHVVALDHGGTNDMFNLKTLCRACHIKIHGRVRSEAELAWAVLLHERSVVD